MPLSYYYIQHAVDSAARTRAALAPGEVLLAPSMTAVCIVAPQARLAAILLEYSVSHWAASRDMSQ